MSANSSPRQFALDVVRQLREAGFKAVWAGGCVRDQLLGLTPKDYDVATSAEPDEVRELFGRRRTLAMGASFGVITIVGSKQSGNIEVATFRKDEQYSDGRRPDGVVYSSAREDAQRRDFTINGLFYDPIQEEVIDYVGGKEDLAAGRLRAIGRAEDRIAEDKLRMLRAVRFAARLEMEIEPSTLKAVQDSAASIHVVSGERIGAEMRKVLAAPHPRAGIELLYVTQLAQELAPEWGGMQDAAAELMDEAVRYDRNASFVLCLAVLSTGLRLGRQDQERIVKRWKLSNDESRSVANAAKAAATIMSAKRLAWPVLQRTLAADADAEQLGMRTATIVSKTAACFDNAHEQRNAVDAIAWAMERTRGERGDWDPSPLVDGDQLKAAGLEPGPQFRRILDHVRDEQLEGRVGSAGDALALALEFARQQNRTE